MKLFAHLFWVTIALSLGACSNMRRAALPTHSFAEARVFGATALAFSPHGKRLATLGRHTDSATASDDESVRLYDLNLPYKPK